VYLKMFQSCKTVMVSLCMHVCVVYDGVWACVQTLVHMSTYSHICLFVINVYFLGVMIMFSHLSNNLFAGGLSQLQLCGGTVQ